ncbi:oxidoreductase [Oxalobacteraceae bacterium]|nr:oxidoreductase [Oxalobacteraceae bacterium]
MEAVITAITDSGEIRVFELSPRDGAPLPAYQAGAHLDLTLGNGMQRQYSLCCAQPSPHSYRIAVKREPQSRGGSAWLHTEARVGTVLPIGAPRNAFALMPQARQHLLFAGGIGITPILSMAYELLRRGQPFELHYFVRDAAALAFAEELRAAPLARHVRLAVGLGAEAAAARIQTTLYTAQAEGTQVYVCGPPGFMDTVKTRAAARLGAAAVHAESFSAPAGGGDDQPFILRLLRSGRDITVPAGETALASLQAAGLDVECSCEVGVCGSCRLGVADGVPEHRDAVLSEQERNSNRCFMPCVSRSRTPVLQIDL